MRRSIVRHQQSARLMPIFLKSSDMNALDLLLSRTSCPKLTQPGPSAEQFSVIQRAALQVPDHANLQPYRFVVFKDDGLQRLADLLVAAVSADGAEPALIERTASLPFRAPMVVACFSKVVEHDKVPTMEQILTAGCAVMAMQQAAFAQGLGAIWRTGPLAEHPIVRDYFNLSADDILTGFLYIGTPEVTMPNRARPNVDNFFSLG